MSKDDDHEEWLTVDAVIASGLEGAPRSSAAASRLCQRLRRDSPHLIKRQHSTRRLLIHLSAIDPDTAPPHSMRVPGRADEALIWALWEMLPPRLNGSRPAFDEIAAAFLLLGYRLASKAGPKS